jgi:ubiquitin carboxyl-terminal hydrolase 34
MPMNMLLEPENFEQLFVLMQSLSNLRLTSEKGMSVPHPKAQILSRRVWDILMLLPTNPHIKDVFQNIGQASEEQLRMLLSPESPQKLMYTFYIVDWLGRPVRLRRHSGVVEQGDPTTGDQPWIQRFISAGGLRRLFEIFASGELQPHHRSDDSLVWCEWRQDCLSALLKLLVQFGVDSHDYAALADQLVESSNAQARHQIMNAFRKKIICFLNVL